MRTTVTAILVAKHHGEMLHETLSAIEAQTHAPDRLIAVTTGSDNALANDIASRGVSRVLAAGHRVSFGQAVKHGVDAAPAAGEHEWLWFLTEDSAPEPEALERILAAVQSAPSVAVAGPKLLDWDDPSRIIELGEGLTWAGSRWRLDRQELDQQQYDHLQDILGVGPVGMLVRRDVWEQLGGFDPALPVIDDGLDFSVRARLAGYRVVVAPASRVRFGQGGIAGAKAERRASTFRTAHRHRRRAQLHRRLSYAPALLVPLYWLALPIIGVLGMVWALIRERPSTMFGELWAALSVFFTPGRIARSRRRRRQNSSAGWGAVRPLRTDRKTIRTVRAVNREIILASQGRQRRELHFISTGGLALVVVTAVLSIGLTWWLFGASFATGGGMARLSDSVGALWQSTISNAAVSLTSWVPFADANPADPFSWVLALFGTVTFWNPSLAPVLLLIVAIPTATLGGWFWGANLTESTVGRVLSGVAWGVGPMLLGAIESGRLGAVILAMVLPWLFLTAARAATSWSYAGTTSLLAAVALACAPVLIPAGIVLLVAGLISHPTRAARIVSIAIAPLTLFAPKLLHTIAIGRPLDLLIDPGLPQAYQPGTTWHMLLGFPTFGLEGWGDILRGLGVAGAPVTLLVGVLLIPLVALALAGLYSGRPWVTLFAALTGAMGLVTGVVSSKLLLTPVGDSLIPVWAGSGLALYWVAIITLAAVGATALWRAATPVAAIALCGVLVIVGPSLVNLATGNVAVKPGQSSVPAVVEAAALENPEVRTLFITALSETDLRGRLVDGSGTKLNLIRTSDLVEPMTEREERATGLIAGIASTGGPDLRAEFAADDVGFVVLTPEQSRAGDADAVTGSALAHAQLQAAFDQNVALTPVGETQHGLLWRVNPPDATEAVDSFEGEDTAVTTERTPISGRAIWIAQFVLLGAMFLLALPTGEVRERPAKRPRKRARAVHVAVPAAGPAPAPVAVEPEPAVEPESAAEPEPTPEAPAAPEPQSWEPASTDEPVYYTNEDDVYEEPDDETIIVNPNEEDDR